MEIVWLGHSCFRIRGREAAVVTDPCPPGTGYNIGKLSASIVTISHDHTNHSYRKGVAGSPRVIDGPGEYEMDGAFIDGVLTYHDSQKGAERGRNIAFIMEMDNLRLCHLGDLGHVPTADQVEEMSGVHILLVPVGGHTTIDGGAAAEVVSLLGPNLVIPMHYETPAAAVTLDPLDRFLREMGVKAHEPQAKLSVSRSALPQETQVVVLDYKR
jgi:L-ascorbate metabolism protein UlaG (beta-lactamase superfamily)